MLTKKKKPLFPERDLEKAPVGYRFMRSLPLHELQKVEEPVRSSYSRRHGSEHYHAHYSYKPISRFHLVELYK